MAVCGSVSHCVALCFSVFQCVACVSVCCITSSSHQRQPQVVGSGSVGEMCVLLRARVFVYVCEYMFVCVLVRAGVCVCVRESERERERLYM